MYVLDTNVVSELRLSRSRRSPAVHAWAQVQTDNQLFLSVVTKFELEMVELRIARRDAVQAARLQDWRLQLLAQFAGRILPFTELTTRFCAALHVPDPRSFRDAMIAAAALEHGFTVVTRNVADFAGTGVRLVNPWEFESSST